jgi:hypothetical protein
MSSRFQLESLLSARGFGLTLPRFDAQPTASADDELRLLLRAGPPRGAITELVRDGASGVTSLALHLAARALGQTNEQNNGTTGHIAWLDPDHCLDPHSAHAAGIPLDRLLWVRRAARKSDGIALFLQAAQILVHAGGFRLVVLDFAGTPARVLHAIPRSVWFRLLRAVERSRTALLVLSPAPLTTTCSTLTIGVRRSAPLWQHTQVTPDHTALLAGARLELRVLTSRRLRLTCADNGAPKKPPAALGLECLL